MDFTEINSRGKRGKLSGRIDRQISGFRTAKTTIIKFGLRASFVELESAKSALNEKRVIKPRRACRGNKQGVPKCMPATFKVWSCDLLIVIENSTYNGNCRRLKLNGKLLGMIGMRGIRTLSPLASPVKIVDFTICLPNSVIRNRVPLHNLGISKLHINKTGSTLTCNSNLCDDTTDNSKNYRNSTG
ncbi:uncharacterized protein TNCV_1383261 [Trichonephila clavipes]|nr:uncharacterized protein TNCV_1383261 [Trichonephila clavipes]